MQHVANHATLHRGQVVGMMRQLGIAPPSTDLFFFLRREYLHNNPSETMTESWERGEYLITTDRSRLDARSNSQFFVTRVVLAVGRSVAVVKRSLDNSLCFGNLQKN